MKQKLLSFVALGALLLCTACAVSPNGNVDWMHNIPQSPATGGFSKSIFDE
jgi:hypothetical protein